MNPVITLAFADELQKIAFFKDRNGGSRSQPNATHGTPSVLVTRGEVRMGSGKRYHPDDSPRSYLRAGDVARVLSALRSSAKTDADRDSLKFIEEHERLQRARYKGEMDAQAVARAQDALAHKYLAAHGDWVQNASRLYWQFYKRVHEDGVQPVTV